MLGIFISEDEFVQSYFHREPTEGLLKDLNADSVSHAFRTILLFSYHPYDHSAILFFAKVLWSKPTLKISDTNHKFKLHQLKATHKADLRKIIEQNSHLIVDCNQIQDDNWQPLAKKIHILNLASIHSSSNPTQTHSSNSNYQK